jgi:hypothetical protein
MITSNPSRRPNYCPPLISLATARRRSPAAEILHHKHHVVMLLIQSISPSYLLDQGGRRHRCAVRVHLSETPPDEGMTPRSSIFAYLVPAKEEARSKDTRSPQGPALRLGVEGKKYL